VKMGSVKDITIIEPAYIFPSENQPGIANFIFSDRYSVFDWGEMPDHIKDKGRALAVMAAFNFEGLEKRGIKTHYRGLVASDGELIKFSDLEEGSNGSNTIQVDMAVVYRPIARKFIKFPFIGEDGKPEIKYDYSFFDVNRGKLNNYLIGLEIIFRNALPRGSSVFRKIAKAKSKEDPVERKKELNKIYQKLGLTSEPKPGDVLPKSVLNYTTKLESGDRSLSKEEAYKISGLDSWEFPKVEILALKVNDFITKQAKKTGFVHYDGKVEMMYNYGLAVVDVTGTFDENRLGFNGEQVSKEVLRQWYEKNQPEFRAACDKWKKTGEGWQQRCDVKPRKLPPEFSELVSKMYMAGCNRYVEKQIFDVLDLEEVMDSIRPFR